MSEAAMNGEVTREAWRIEDDQTADWAVKKIREAEAEVERWEAYYDAQIEKVRKNSENTIAYMTERLSEYFETVPHKETKTLEKYALPSGELVLRKAKTVWKHDDEALLLEWCKENGYNDCIKVSERVNWLELKKRLVEMPGAPGIVCDTESGVVCHPVTVETEEEKFTVSVNE